MIEDVNSINIQEIKQNREFLEFLDVLETEMRSENSIAKGYQLLDAKLILEEDEDQIDEIFSFLVTHSLEKLTDKLLGNEKFDTTNQEDLATARAIYEHAIQKYSESDTKSAKELFFGLAHTINDGELKDAMLIHAVAIMAGYSFEDFFEKLVAKDVDFESEISYFVHNFTEPNEKLFVLFKEQVDEAKEILEKLKGYNR